MYKARVKMTPLIDDYDDRDAPVLIAEIGNNHFGDMNSAYEHISTAVDCGADAVKFQAIRPENLLKGSMPYQFYEDCAFSLDQYIELIEYGKSLKTIVFFSIFDKTLESLRLHESLHKISAGQLKEMTLQEQRLFDCVNTFISVNDIDKQHEIYKFRRATLMWASQYYWEYQHPDIVLGMIPKLKKLFFTDIGYSCHVPGVECAIESWRQHKVVAIEKHFTLEKDKKWDDIVFRDTVHGASPKEFERLCLAVK